MTLVSLKPVVVALMLILAGCGGILGPEDETSTPTETDTPTPIPTETATPTPTTPTQTPMDQEPEVNHTKTLIEVLRSEDTTAAELNTPYEVGGEAYTAEDYRVPTDEFTTAALRIRSISLKEHSAGPGQKLVIQRVVDNASHRRYTTNVIFLAYVHVVSQIRNSDEPAQFNQIEVENYRPRDNHPRSRNHILERDALYYQRSPNEFTLLRAIRVIGTASRNIAKHGEQRYPVGLDQRLDDAVESAGSNLTIDRVEMHDENMRITFTSDVNPEDRSKWAAEKYLILRAVGAAELDGDIPDRVTNVALRGHTTHGSSERDLISWVTLKKNETVKFTTEEIAPVDAGTMIARQSSRELGMLNK